MATKKGGVCMEVTLTKCNIYGIIYELDYFRLWRGDMEIRVQKI